MADIKKNKQRVRYEFYSYQGTNPVANTQISLKLENPAEVRFINVGPGGGINDVTINNIYGLQSVSQFTTIGADKPYELILKNNLDEYDVTNYSISLTPGAVLNIICKYYVN